MNNNNSLWAALIVLGLLLAFAGTAAMTRAMQVASETVGQAIGGGKP